MQKRGVFATAMMIAVFGQLSITRDAAAQPYRYGVGWTAGNTYVTELNSHRRPGAVLDPSPISPGLGFTLGLHLDRWYGDSRRLGVRFQGFYERPQIEWRGEKRGIDAGSGDVSVVYRLRDAAEGVLPFVTAGVGGIWYDMGEPRHTFALADAYFDGDSELLPLVAFGLGVDTPPFWTWYDAPVRIRFELADHLVLRSPLERISDRERHGSVHHMRLTFGMYSALYSPLD